MIAVTLAMSLVFPVLGNPVVILCVALATFSVLGADRPTAVRMGVGYPMLLALVVWAP